MSRGRKLAKALLWEGAFLISVGLGWVFGAFAGEWTRPAIVFIGGGALCLVAGWGLGRLLKPASARASRLAPIDLTEVERALKAHGRQPPLFDDNESNGQATLLSSTNPEWTLSGPAFLVHGGGGELRIAGADGTWVPFENRQVVRLDRSSGTVRCRLKDRGSADALVIAYKPRASEETV